MYNNIDLTTSIINDTDIYNVVNNDLINVSVNDYLNTINAIHIYDNENNISLDVGIIQELYEIILTDSEEEKIFNLYKNFERIFGMTFEEYQQKISKLQKENPEKFI